MKYFAVNPIYLKHNQSCAVDYRVTSLVNLIIMVLKDSGIKSSVLDLTMSLCL